MLSLGFQGRRTHKTDGGSGKSDKGLPDCGGKSRYRERRVLPVFYKSVQGECPGIACGYCVYRIGI